MKEAHLAATRAVWTDIAPAFERTRQRAWPPVLRWAARHVLPRSRVLDLACGNGRHGGPLVGADREVVGADFSRPLLSFARERGVRVVEAEAGHLPFKEHAFDAALFVAALHNIPGRARRIAALAELARTLKPGAPALVTVWSRWQRGRISHFLLELPHHVLGDADHEFGDAIVPWKQGEAERGRYYHFYGRFELREDLRAAGLEVRRIRSERIVARGVLGDNLFAEVRAPGTGKPYPEKS